MRKRMVALLAGAMLMMATSAMATLIPGTSSGWSVGGNLNTFLGLSFFPGVETSISALDFAGKWKFTAIGAESGNYNIVEKPVAGVPGSGWSGPGLSSTVAFGTANTTNWGLWNTVDFNATNLFFEDVDGPFNVKLDPFLGTTSPAGFKIYQLTQDSNPLTYLPNSLTLKKGTYVVGFNDNSKINNDSDYDDLIIAMVAPVPEPGTMMLLGFGMLGMAVYGKRRMNKQA